MEAFSLMQGTGTISISKPFQSYIIKFQKLLLRNLSQITFKCFTHHHVWKKNLFQENAPWSILSKGSITQFTPVVNNLPCNSQTLHYKQYEDKDIVKIQTHSNITGNDHLTSQVDFSQVSPTTYTPALQKLLHPYTLCSPLIKGLHGSDKAQETRSDLMNQKDHYSFISIEFIIERGKWHDTERHISELSFSSLGEKISVT